ncbi:DNA polymerase III, beta subunit [Beutenbergia cavernae DSM 12333]|uniref:Beta sliding clamp n=1 Tax=Beutenbergia cavernae (strain ATCC BAA-8 / DSM 12333 / CCUG 43141 / JCM 11478 / NBRC 16432 / NCIMB 13614 / HKI 0122) TaxID=471853 RepID=C5BUP4_BEUC1|nr:DNA polymerase III subunit beta [Beutenbergia cavernae]ACQ78268.1 DNA polymerase III, beta subunit [Beutenbergia cavernae DSM 12333]
MKFRVDRDVLADAVTWTARTLPTRPSIPVLAGVRIEADPQGALRLSSFDYEVSALSEIAADVPDAGTVLVSGRLLAEISRALPGKPVDVELDGTRVVLTCGSSRFTLLTMPLDDYPSLPAMPPASGTVDAGTLAEAVAQVTIAASRDETLPLLTGVRVEIEGDKLTLLATDRYRLAMRELSWNPASPGLEATALVRARTLSEVAKSLTSAGAVSISLPNGDGKDLVGFEAGGRRTTSLLVEGDYPPVRRLFPEATTSHAVASTNELVEAARRVSLVAERNTPIRLTFSEGQVVLEAGQGDDAQASEAIESTLTGEPITTAFNPGYLLDGLGVVGTEFTRLSFTHGTKPAVLTGQPKLEDDDADRDVFRYLIQPIRFAS